MSRKKTPRGGKRGPAARRGGIRTASLLQALKRAPGQSATTRQLAKALELNRADQYEALERSVRSLLRDGTIEYRGKRLHLTEEKSHVGTLIAHPDGFGFVRLGTGRESDEFVPRREMQGLMHGDRIRVRIASRRGRRYAQVLEVVEPAGKSIVGQFCIRGGTGVVEPRSRRFPEPVLIRKQDAGGAHDGDWVRIEVRRDTHPLRGRVTEVLADVLRPSSLISLVIAEQSLPGAFPESVLEEAGDIPDIPSTDELETRIDLTHLPFVTIDGEDAKDFDDAICVLPRGDGFEAWVAIADVAHYVTPDSALDREASARANSFYFPDRVIPMLPEHLSNGVCSLNPAVERLAMVVRMRYDSGGRRRAVRIFEGLIRSQARLTYTQVGAWLESGDTTAVADKGIREMLKEAERLYGMFERLRQRRGALDLDLPEVRAVIDHDEITGMQVRERNIAHKLIEEMMLEANTAVAHFLEEKQVPLLYRVHEPPKQQSIETLNEFLEPFGLRIPIHAARPTRPADVQRVLEQVEGKEMAHVLHRLVLRAMQQARYTPDNAGHFGLAYKSYCHFTSPIRRYADLTVHRRLKAVVRDRNPDAVQPAEGLATIGEITSSQERKQTQSEWDTQAMLGALYHRKDVGMIFQAVIAGISERRIFFELQPMLTEGSMGVETLEGNYVLDKRAHRLVERRSGHAFALGDRVDVRIDAVDPVRGLIDVSLHLEPEA